MTSLYLQPYKWEVVDKGSEEGQIQIQCYALDREDNPYLLRIEDYPATCFLEYPNILTTDHYIGLMPTLRIL